jgi:iron complex outermembrane receptor protein
VRTPSRAESDIRLNYGEANGFPGIFVSSFGNPAMKSEELLAFELGYRVRPTDRVALDFTMFYNDYNHVRTIQIGNTFPEDTPPPPHTTVPVLLVTDGSAETWGAELAADFYIRPWWIIRASYSFISIVTDNVYNSTGAEETPHNVFSLQNRFDLPHNLEFDTTLRYVEDIKSLSIPSYLEMDARFAWHPTKDLEISIAGQNLFAPQHAEYDDIITRAAPTQVQRGVYGKVTWRF